ncbi:MAG: methyltransferase domain-containing protein [Spirochaetales bacterium]|nr:methyltransferase domain-containing protein [Spirochaetales bacterium]
MKLFSSIHKFLSWCKRKFYMTPGQSHLCYICRKGFWHFYPHRKGQKSVSPFIKEIDVIHSDIEHFLCPHCYCQDRERHLFMYFDSLRLWDKIKNSNVLHIAPEKNLKEKIQSLGPKEYIKGDLIPESDDVQKIDIMAIPFPGDYFDFIICNHVLEHIPDDKIGMSELYRVLKPGGYAILQTPVSGFLSYTFEDPSIITEKQRAFFYDKEDHVRVFGRDFYSKIEQTGFSLELVKHGDLFSSEDAAYYGVNQREDLILVKKNLYKIK